MKYLDMDKIQSITILILDIEAGYYAQSFVIRAIISVTLATI